MTISVPQLMALFAFAVESNKLLSHGDQRMDLHDTSRACIRLTLGLAHLVCSTYSVVTKQCDMRSCMSELQMSVTWQKLLCPLRGLLSKSIAKQ